ncbi:MAG: M48 family metalloprotease [Chloroflexi bacterium]|nr:M48 family metalloprotease [Chloroflexota bacterium]
MSRIRIPTGRSRSRRMGGSRIVAAVVMAVVALISYYSSRSFNPVTNEEQYVAITPDQEIALGLQSLPQMTQQHGGLYPDEELQQYLDDICSQLIFSSAAAQTDWPFECHLLADDQTINAFALPGGQMFMTLALYEQLDTEGQVAGVMAHEIGHVIARHSAQQIAKSQLTQGLSGAAVMAAYDPSDPRSAGTAQVVALIGQTVNMKFGRDDELQSDYLGVQFMAEAGYDPSSLIGVMEVLAEASSGNRQPEFMSTHPNPENRIGQIQLAIDEIFPDGVPEGYIP